MTAIVPVVDARADRPRRDMVHGSGADTAERSDYGWSMPAP
jgi:putative hydrolase of the HAD superfamily